MELLLKNSSINLAAISWWLGIKIEKNASFGNYDKNSRSSGRLIHLRVIISSLELRFVKKTRWNSIISSAIICLKKKHFHMCLINKILNIYFTNIVISYEHPSIAFWKVYWLSHLLCQYSVDSSIDCVKIRGLYLCNGWNNKNHILTKSLII